MAEKKERVPKTNLLEISIGTVDGNQTLVAKDDNRQVWKNEKGRCGVVKVENNKYVVLQRVGVDEEIAMQIMRTGIVPEKPVKPAPKEKTKAKKD